MVRVWSDLLFNPNASELSSMGAVSCAHYSELAYGFSCGINEQMNPWM